MALVAKSPRNDGFTLEIQKFCEQSLSLISYWYLSHKLSSSYVAGSDNEVNVQVVKNLDEQADEYLDVEGGSQEYPVLYGIQKLGHHYGALMIQLGESLNQQEEPNKKVVGISKSLSLTNI